MGLLDEYLIGLYCRMRGFSRNMGGHLRGLLAMAVKYQYNPLGE